MHTKQLVESLALAASLVAAPLVAGWVVGERAAYSQAATTTDPQAEIAALKAEIEALKGMVPSQSHTMVDVEFNFANLWFAGKAGNWPLATFYLNETRSHLGWTVRLRAVRPLPGGGQLDLRPILKGIEDGALTTLKGTVDKQDEPGFEAAYQQMLTQCYACHEAAAKPF